MFFLLTVVFYTFSIPFQIGFMVAKKTYNITTLKVITIASYKENIKRENACRKKDETRRDVSKQNLWGKITYMHLLWKTPY